MKRLQLFEFEDLPWFPHWIRSCMTRYISAFHKLLGTSRILAKLIARVLPYTENEAILDLCSGSGGPMVEVLEILKKEYGYSNLHLLMSDLYPDKNAMREINDKNCNTLTYLTSPINAAAVEMGIHGLRTMICSMHHMPPDTAHKILKNAQEDNQPLLIYEISDNSVPTILWWLAIPLAFIMVFFITPMVRPMTWQQLIFTYMIPLLPLFISWDGAVSNVRTYTLSDMEILLRDLKSDGYSWEKGILKGKAGKNLYLIGLPNKI